MTRLDSLMAEFRAIELWDRAGENVGSEDEINRAGFEARRMRRCEIIRDIELLSRQKKPTWPVGSRIEKPR
jgi:hypothetical protein